MSSKLKKASIAFWILAGTTLFLALALSSYSHDAGLSIVGMLSVIPGLIAEIFTSSVQLLIDERAHDFEIENQIRVYVLFIIPIVFASIAIVLRMIAKAFDEQTIAMMNLMSEDKKKSKEVIQ